MGDGKGAAWSLKREGGARTIMSLCCESILVTADAMAASRLRDEGMQGSYARRKAATSQSSWLAAGRDLALRLAALSAASSLSGLLPGTEKRCEESNSVWPKFNIEIIQNS